MKWGSLFKPKKTEYPEFIREYLELDFKSSSKRELSKAEICVFDCETTGLDSDAKVISFGGVIVSGRQINLKEMKDLSFPHENASGDSEVHGELGNDLDESIIEKNMEEILYFISNRIIAGHNIQFDVKKISQLISNYYPGFHIKNKVIDTVTLEKRIDPIRFERSIGGNALLSLDHLCEKYSVPVENRHNALGDAYLTALVMLSQFTSLRNRGIHKLASVTK